MADPGTVLMVRRDIMAHELGVTVNVENYVVIPNQTRVEMTEELEGDVEISYRADPDGLVLTAVLPKKAFYEPVVCRYCGDEWPRHPALEVACPKCGAGIGKPCKAKRPSGHQVVLGTEPHIEREQIAVDAGIWAKCQIGAPGHEQPEPKKAKAKPEPKPEKAKPKPVVVQERMAIDV
jgi:hypothetical protein